MFVGHFLAEIGSLDQFFYYISETVIHRINHYLRLVFTSDGVGVGIVSEVSRATESESEESESFHFLPIPPKTPSLVIK